MLFTQTFYKRKPRQHGTAKPKPKTVAKQKMTQNNVTFDELNNTTGED